MQVIIYRTPIVFENNASITHLDVDSIINNYPDYDINPNYTTAISEGYLLLIFKATPKTSSPLEVFFT